MITAISLLMGACVGVALLLVVVAFRRPVPHLAASLAAFDDSAAPRWADRPAEAGREAQPADRIERLGVWVRRVARLSPSKSLEAQLRLRNVSQAQFYGQQLGTAIALPIAVLSLAFLVGQFVAVPWTIPAGVMVAAVPMGWTLPRLQLTSHAPAIRADASEALLVYIDLVVLERLAGRHIADALANAAGLSDNPLFVQLRTALNRAELARESPWTELTRLADRLQMPALADLAGIARLQDEGASLTEALRARAAELRNAHVVARQQESDQVTIRMDIAKTIPVLMVLGLFAAPPILRLFGAS